MIIAKGKIDCSDEGGPLAWRQKKFWNYDILEKRLANGSGIFTTSTENQRSFAQQTNILT